MTSSPSSFCSLNEAFLSVVGTLLNSRSLTAPRGLKTREVVGASFCIRDPRRRYVSVPQRKWSIAYAIGELCWHLRASESTDEIAFYAPRWRKIAGDKARITGSSYGAKIFTKPAGQQSQWERTLNLLRQDPDSRRAVLVFADSTDESLDANADVACALSLQFVIREAKLHALCTMRSNDAILGMPYDIFLFTMLQEMAAKSLGCALGEYHHYAGSLHLYESQFDMAERIAKSRPEFDLPMSSMAEVEGAATLLEGEAICRLSDRGHRGPADSRSGYWGGLLEVIEAWCGARNELEYGPTVQLADPVLNELFQQWSRSRGPRSDLTPSLRAREALGCRARRSQ